MKLPWRKYEICPRCLKEIWDKEMFDHLIEHAWLCIFEAMERMTKVLNLQLEIYRRRIEVIK